MVFEEYPNLNAELRGRKAPPILTAIRETRSPRQGKPRPTRKPNNNHQTERVHLRESPQTLPPPPKEAADDPAVEAVATALVHRSASQPNVAKAREKVLQSTPSNSLSQSQSAPVLPAAHNPPSLPSQPIAPLVLGKQRHRVRYARRSQPGWTKLAPPLQPLPTCFGVQDDNFPIDPPPVQDMGCFLTEMELPSEYIPVADALALASYQLYGEAKFDTALATFRGVLRLAEELDDIPLQALVYHHMGTAEKELGDLKSSLASQTKCINLARSVHHLKLQGRGFKGLGVVYVGSSQYALAYDYHLKCLAIATSEHDIDLASRTYANLGNVFLARHQYPDAVESHAKDLSLSTQLNSYAGMARAHRNLALVYAKMNQVDKQRYHDAQASALGPSPFLHDMLYHAYDVVANITWPLQTSSGPNSPLLTKTGQCLLALLAESSG
ncbi:hypothetical protein LEN26_016475 [Aphanomyces euteiches]|nr:hypothetical protein LEN26_016475 [Aphanomyces euteiches]KAH9190907.1 hypothetical protein AeNC1_007114 [Aphanomyces euteiches]